MLCFLYVIAISTLLSIAGSCVERLLPSHAPRRWVWFGIIVVSLLIPPIYQAKHKIMVPGGTGSNASLWGMLSAFDGTLMKLWMIASVVLVVWTLIDVMRVRLLSRSATAAIVDGVPVWITESLGPATVGVIAPRVLIPRWVMELSSSQRAYVVHHEDEHRKANDPRMLLLPALLLILAPWNLALWWQARRLSLAIEIDCDYRVVSKFGNERAYAELLLDIAQATNGGPRLQPGFLGRGNLEQRLRTLVNPAQLSRAMRLVLPVVAVVLLYFVISSPHPVRSAHHSTHTSQTHP